MATTATTYLANPTVMIGAVDVTAMCSSATLTVGFDSLEATSFGDTGHHDARRRHPKRAVHLFFRPGVGVSHDGKAGHEAQAERERTAARINHRVSHDHRARRRASDDRTIGKRLA